MTFNEEFNDLSILIRQATGSSQKMASGKSAEKHQLANFRGKGLRYRSRLSGESQKKIFWSYFDFFLLCNGKILAIKIFPEVY